MSFLLQYDGVGLEDYESDDDLIDSCSSNDENSLQESYVEELKTENTVKSRTTTTKLRKAKRASFPTFEAPVPAPRGRLSGDSTISSTASHLVSSSLPFSTTLPPPIREKGMKKKTNAKRSVRFSREDEWFYVLPLRKYNKKERKNCWYTKSELIKRYASLDLIELRIEAKKEPKEHETFRGLEELDEKHREKCEKRRSAVVQAVLDAQEECDSEDPLFLAVASRALTVDSKTEAFQKGIADMLEVHESDPAKKRRSLPSVEKSGTIVDPFCVPDRPRRNSAPVSSLHQTQSAMDDDKELMEALALLDDIDISAPPAPPLPAVFLTPEETGESKKGSSTSAARRHSLDSSSKHNKSKSKSKSSTTSSSGKTQSNIAKSPDRPRRYSAPASSLHQTLSAKDETKEMMQALPPVDDIDICVSPAPTVPTFSVKPEAGKSKKRTSSPSKRHSLDSSSKHKSKSKSRTSSTSSSSGKTKSDSAKSLPSPRSPVKKKIKASIANLVAQASPKKKDSSKSRADSKSPSSKDRQPSRSSKLPFSLSSSSPSPAASPTASPSSSKTTKHATTSRKRLVSSPVESSRTSSSSTSSTTKKKHSALAKSPGGSHIIPIADAGSSLRIEPLRKDPPGMFTRISSIRLDDQYPPSVPRL